MPPFVVNEVTHDSSGLEYVTEAAGPFDTEREAETAASELAMSEQADIFHTAEVPA